MFHQVREEESARITLSLFVLRDAFFSTIKGMDWSDFEKETSDDDMVDGVEVLDRSWFVF